ncbi:phage tail protein [Paraburkholderia sp. RL18-103-BIB-C]|uniref:host specificity protein J n=1 Tax=Paraburkholderia sp. RL18-103-BIB-C TaxID=3031637 RepID=UPI0038BBE22E
MAGRDLIPIIGAGGGGGKGGGGDAARAPVEAPDTLRSVQYARVINVLCEGEIEDIVGGPQGIYCDDTPLANADGTWNFNGAWIDWRSGSASQSPIPGFSAAEAETAVGVKVTAAAAVVRTVTNPNITAIRVTVGFPVMTDTNPTTGDINGTSVQLALDLQRDGGGWQQMFVDTVVGKTTARYQRSYRLSLARFGTAGGTYDIRVRRITPDSTTVNEQNAFNWESLTEIVDSTLIYPYSALCGVQVDASTFKAIPKLSFDAKLRRVQVPSNYDPVSRLYVGVWDGTFKIAWTDNPAWVIYDLATTARFGLGAYLSPQLVDKWTLYTIAQYCDASIPDGFGGYEPRYTCNCYIQQRSDAIALLQQFASIFNGLIFWSGGTLTFSADMPADVVAVYTPANVVDGAFSYIGTPLNQRHTTALITWNNPANRYQQEIEYVEDADAIAQWGIRELQITALGCTSRGQAHRIGKWALLTEKMLSETVTFKTGINAAYARPGDVFATTDPVRAGVRNGGRVLDATADTVHLDAPAHIENGIAYTLTVLMPDGTFQTRSVAVDLAGEVDALTVSPAFTMVPQRMSVWALAGSNVENELWRCISVVEDEEGNVEISGVAYNASKFDAIEQGLQLQVPPTSLIDPFNIAPCTELNITESKYQISPVLIGARCTFSWLAPLGAVRYSVTYQFENDTPVFLDAVFSSSVDIQPTREGTWYFTVWAINSIGVRSGAASVTVQLRALNMPPEDVKGFQLDIISDNANLTWQSTTDLDVIVGGNVVIRYNEKMSTSLRWEEGNVIAKYAGAQINGFVALMKGTYLAKFVNSSGVYSENPAYVVSTTGPLRDYNLIATLQQDPLFAGDKVNMVLRNGVLYLAQDPDTGHAVATQGAYYFDTTVDMGKVYTVRCTGYVDGAVYDLLNDVDEWPDWDAVVDVDGEKIDEGGAIVTVSTTNVNPATATAADWSPYTRLIVADLTFRAARFALAVIVPDDVTGMGIITLRATVDVPDRIESRNNVPVAAGGSTILFTIPFKGAPAISIIAQGLASGDKWTITNQSATGFTIQFQNSAGTAIAKTCDWIARGYGYEHTDLDAIGYTALQTGDIDAINAQRRLIHGEPA